MDAVLAALIDVARLAVWFYTWIVIAWALLSWLLAFDILNRRNQAVRAIGDVLYRLTEPALRPIRRIMPDLGGVDISPVALILILVFIDGLLRRV